MQDCENTINKLLKKIEENILDLSITKQQFLSIKITIRKNLMNFYQIQMIQNGEKLQKQDMIFVLRI